MIKLFLILQLLSVSFETYSSNEPQWKDWQEKQFISLRNSTTIIEISGSEYCQRQGIGIVCGQIVQPANAGPGRAYTITNGFIFNAPNLDDCLVEWIRYQVWVPFFNKWLYEWLLSYPHKTINLLMEMPEDFMLFGLQIEKGNNIGFWYSWWETDPCLEED